MTETQAIPPKPAAATVAVKTDPTKNVGAIKATAVQADTAFTISSGDDDFEYLNMLVYAQPGAGKTTLCGSAADVEEMRDVIMLDFESGKMTIKNNPRIKHPEFVDTIRITNFKQLGKVHEFLKIHCRLRDQGKEEELKVLQAKFFGVTPDKVKRVRHYRTVLVDSVSELDTLSMYEMLGISTVDDLNKVMNDGDVEVAQFAEFRKNNQMMQLVIRAYRDLPMNAIFVCHASFMQDELKRVLWAPALTGKLAKQIQGFVDIVGYLKVGEIPAGTDQKEGPRRFYVQPVGKFDAKCRVASFKESWLDNPVMQDVWDICTSEDD